MLQARFIIICGLARLMEQEEIGIVLKVCVILHNIIVEDERDNYELTFVEWTILELIVSYKRLSCYEVYFQRKNDIHSQSINTCMS